jgi:hypothetical protein
LAADIRVVDGSASDLSRMIRIISRILAVPSEMKIAYMENERLKRLRTVTVSRAAIERNRFGSERFV